MVSFDGSQYVDSCACLSGFGPDHEVLCTISNRGAVNGLEVEILLGADTLLTSSCMSWIASTQRVAFTWFAGT
jgi:hypothetical protein